MQKTNSEGTFKKLVHLDQKILAPSDKAQAKVDHTHNHKSIIGKPKIYDLKGNLLAEEENLVVLEGREFLAQKLMGLPSDGGTDLTQYNITYFGVGEGGTAGGANPTTIGPYDLDSDLAAKVLFTNTSSEISSGVNGYKYIDSGALKAIAPDDGTGGAIEIIQEEHTVNTATDTLVVSKFTSIKFTLKLDIAEPANKPFRFNEAGLYAVEHIGGIPTNNKVLFARFTTLDKYLDTNDGIIIEWHVLV